MLVTACQFHQHFLSAFFCTNVVLADFSSYMYVEKAAETTFVRKMWAFYVDEIDGRRQFCQHFLRAFFVRTSFLCLEFGFEQTFVKKNTHVKR
jgi:hypothetical protein